MSETETFLPRMDGGVDRMFVKLDQGSAVDRPPHYNQVPGIECIDVVKHFDYLRGNAMKYLWRAGFKDDARQDLQKAIWYIQCEIEELPPEPV